MQIQVLFVFHCPVCDGVYVLSTEEYLEILTNDKKAPVCSVECLNLFCKMAPYSLN